ncbi:hypothetical protein O6P43_022701 [Quillaja saponaria]|uniref:Uncharacterized protein n=1 Tax=Quillaja saponaria TaxID=32244 RepID=A0AAD7LDP4_QUISA|nr:hypothetical protein O6P43_022701 [Quillaja saponaria]
MNRNRNGDTALSASIRLSSTALKFETTLHIVRENFCTDKFIRELLFSCFILLEIRIPSCIVVGPSGPHYSQDVCPSYIGLENSISQFNNPHLCGQIIGDNLFPTELK